MQESVVTRPRLYFFSRNLLRFFFQLCGGISCVGKENVPSSGGVILAPNHISYLDPPAAGACLPRMVHFMAKQELFQSKLLGRWMRAIGTFPVRRGSADRRAIRQVLEYLAQGEVVCVFPEGTRSPDGRLQQAEMGIGMFALKSRAPVVPVAIIGTGKVLPAGGGRLHRHPVKVIYGTPLTFPDLYETREQKTAMEEVGKRVIAAIAELQSGRETREEDDR